MNTAMIGKFLIIGGVMMMLAGLIFLALPRLGVGQLPGDIHIRKDNWTISFPLATSLLVSIILTILLNLFLFFKK